jgi:hypothetical protein
MSTGEGRETPSTEVEVSTVLTSRSTRGRSRKLRHAAIASRSLISSPDPAAMKS